ncbi:MAG: translational GTPase TypA [Bacteroidales bacterium]
MQKLRNIAIIAHVDHGKTTLVDKLLIATGQFKDHEKPGTLIMDSYELEKERGITILAKNVSVVYKNIKINIIDTPGHADFGGEVERVLNMADGVLLLVDAFEGAMPQTRFVLQKALNLGLKPIVVINKVDKQNCQPEIVQEQIFDLMFSLGATEEQLDFPTIYGSAKLGWMSKDWKKASDNIYPLLDAILEHIPAPSFNPGTLQILVTALNYSSYVGRIAIGRIHRGEVKVGESVTLVKRDNSVIRCKVKELFIFEGLGKKSVEKAQSGEICGLVGIEGFEIGDTIADFENPEALDPISIDEPTMSMLFSINDSPFFGQDGKFVTSRHIRDRLTKELEKNLALRLEDTDSADKFIVYGRGVLHLSVLIETMRREGYELQVGQPKVLYKEIGGIKCEPIEEMTVDVLEEFTGRVIDMVTSRKGELLNMENKGDRTIIEFKIPSRGIIGLRTRMLTATNGEAVMSHRFINYEPFKGEIEKRVNGSLIAMEAGIAFAYSIDKLQDRGRFFIVPGQQVYTGQVIGESSKSGDMVVNVCKPKKLTNIRASGSDEKIRLIPPIVFSLEEALEYIQEDEYVEITPKTIRLRKTILDENERKRMSRKA